MQMREPTVKYNSGFKVKVVEISQLTQVASFIQQHRWTMKSPAVIF